MQSLRVFKISNNLISHYEFLKYLRDLDILEFDIANNPVCKMLGYRHIIYLTQPKLRIIDSLNTSSFSSNIDYLNCKYNQNQMNEYKNLINEQSKEILIKTSKYFIPKKDY